MHDCGTAVLGIKSGSFRYFSFRRLAISWIFHMDYQQIALCSFYRGRKTATWSWEIIWENPIHGEWEFAFNIEDDIGQTPAANASTPYISTD